MSTILQGGGGHRQQQALARAPDEMIRRQLQHAPVDQEGKVGPLPGRNRAEGEEAPVRLGQGGAGLGQGRGAAPRIGHGPAGQGEAPVVEGGDPVEGRPVQGRFPRMAGRMEPCRLAGRDGAIQPLLGKAQQLGRLERVVRRAGGPEAQGGTGRMGSDKLGQAPHGAPRLGGRAAGQGEGEAVRAERSEMIVAAHHGAKHPADLRRGVPAVPQGPDDEGAGLGMGQGVVDAVLEGDEQVGARPDQGRQKVPRARRRVQAQVAAGEGGAAPGVALPAARILHHDHPVGPEPQGVAGVVGAARARPCGDRLGAGGPDSRLDPMGEGPPGPREVFGPDPQRPGGVGPPGEGVRDHVPGIGDAGRGSQGRAGGFRGLALAGRAVENPRPAVPLRRHDTQNPAKHVGRGTGAMKVRRPSATPKGMPAGSALRLNEG
jgi:hypothetical protein